MKYVIQARRIECPVLDFNKMEAIYKQDISYIDFISPPFREVLGRNLKSKIVKELLVNLREAVLDIEIHKDWNGKIWAVTRFNYIYQGKLEDEYHRWYGSAQLVPLIRYLDCRETMFVHTVWGEDNVFYDDCKYFLYPIEDKLLYGKASYNKINSLRDVLKLNMLSPLFILKRRDVDERDRKN